MWKFLYDSVVGTSHLSTGGECQDSSFVTRYEAAGKTALILVCADGAGSAAESKVGSSLACKTAIDCVAKFLEEGGGADSLSADVLRSWIRIIHETVSAEAIRRELPPRELACTLLLAVVLETTAAFAQIGDGVIIRGAGGELTPVFWPQNGEYLNSTFFVTDPQFESRAVVEVVPGQVAELAMLTDGLEMLALNIAAHRARPFFTPLFQAIREQPEDELAIPLRQFLESAAVNERTDDDKTLILAMRVPVESRTAV